MTEVWGGIEAGGTRFVCAIGTGPDDVAAQTSFPTTTPSETMARAIDFFRGNRHHELAAVGIGSFGPLDLDLDSPTYGHVTSTPKAGWAGADLVGTIRDALDVPVAVGRVDKHQVIGAREVGQRPEDRRGIDAPAVPQAGGVEVATDRLAQARVPLDEIDSLGVAAQGFDTQGSRSRIEV